MKVSQGEKVSNKGDPSGQRNTSFYTKMSTDCGTDMHFLCNSNIFLKELILKGIDDVVYN